MIWTSALVLGYGFFAGITWVLLPENDDDDDRPGLCVIWPIILPALIAVITVRWLQRRHQNRVPQARIIKKG